MSLSKMNYSYGVVELKYEKGKHVIVKVDWIIDFKPKYNKTQDFFCYWSPDFEDSPEHSECGYSRTFNGLPSLFKVFVVHLTNSIEEAQKYLEGRVKMVAKRFREPGDTEEEMKKIEAKKKRNARKELKEQKAHAQAKNSEYLFSEISEFAAGIDKGMETPEMEPNSPAMSIPNEVIHDSFESIASNSFDEFVMDIMNDNSQDTSVPEVIVLENIVIQQPDMAPSSDMAFLSDVASSSDLSACSSYEEYVEMLMNGQTNRILEIDESKNQDLESLPEATASSMVDGGNVIIISDELIKENQELKVENENLKQELENANKRNLLLQNYLVAADEQAAKTIFIEKDGGRLYRGGVFLNKNQCAVLDKAKSDRDFLNNLATAIFGRKVLETSSISGLPSNRMKGRNAPSNVTSAPGDGKTKCKLDPDLLQLTYDIMDARSLMNKTKKLTKTVKNAIIGKKCTNTANAAEIASARAPAKI